MSSEKLYLKPFEESFITPEYIGWLNNKEIMRYSKQRFRKHTSESCRIYFQSFKESPHCFYRIMRRSDDRLIGTLTAYINPEDQVADIGILIGAADAKSQGYGSEAWALWINFLFEKKNLRKITAGTLANHSAMKRIFEKAHMVREGLQREQEIFEGSSMDVVLYGILRREWEHTNQKKGGTQR